MIDQLITEKEYNSFLESKRRCEEVMENVVIARNLLIGMIKMARRKAMSIYNTPYISFISEKES